MRQTRSTAAHSPNARHPKTRSSARNSKPPPTPKKPARKPSNTTQTSNSQFTVRRSQRHKSSPSPKPVATVIKKNNDYCDTCGGTGRFICCDACPKAFHFSCVEPPMEADQVAEMKDPWFCNECLHRQSNQSISAPQGLFHCLFEDLETKNPKAFQLPFHIRNFFEGVSINKLGGYVDNTIVKPVKYKNGQPLLPDYHQLKDQHGNFILCYACRKTALEKPIIACDYCPLYWHMDCLNPPMPAPPNIAKKWMCPNHVEHALPRRRKRKRPRTVECTCAHHAHDGDIDIIDGSDNEEDGSRATRDVPGHGVGAGIEDQTWKYGGTVYRLPAKAIKLNFLDYARRLRQPCSSRSSSSPSTTLEVATPSSPTSIYHHQTLPSPLTSNDSQYKTSPMPYPVTVETQQWLEGLASFQASNEDVHSISKEQQQDRLRMLIAAVNDNTESSLKDQKHGSQDRLIPVSEHRYQKFLAFERLLEMKGEDAVTKMLMQDR